MSDREVLLQNWIFTLFLKSNQSDFLHYFPCGDIPMHSCLLCALSSLSRWSSIITVILQCVEPTVCSGRSPCCPCCTVGSIYRHMTGVILDRTVRSDHLTLTHDHLWDWGEDAHYVCCIRREDSWGPRSAIWYDVLSSSRTDSWLYSIAQCNTGNHSAVHHCPVQYYT